MAPEEIERIVIEILRREIRLVCFENVDGDEVWRVKEGNIEHCAQLIAAALEQP